MILFLHFYSTINNGGGVKGSDGLLISASYSSGAITLGGGGTQTAGGTKCTGTESTGTAGSFGVGGTGNRIHGGGGGGWYGGAGACNSYYKYSSGAGGSGYLNTDLLISGTTSTTNGINSGDGHAKITLVTETINASYIYLGKVQTYTAPSDGIYKLEVWGAQGGTSNYKEGGKGGYSTGNI